MIETIKHRINEIFPRFEGEGQMTGSRLIPALNHFCLLVRHDMDCISHQKKLDLFLEQDAQNANPSTLFILEDDIQLFARNKDILAEKGYELQLHSEAKPKFVVTAWKMRPEGWLSWRYTRNLSSQQAYMDSLFKKSGLKGHCAHTSNNHLYFKNALNWNIIERASCDAGYDYISDWRIPARTPEGTCFSTLTAPYWHVHGERRVLVLPTLWDDKFFFQSFEEAELKSASTHQPAEKTLDIALENALDMTRRCREMNIPFIVNLHPIHMINSSTPVGAFKAALCRKATEQGWPVKTMQDYVRSCRA